MAKVIGKTKIKAPTVIGAKEKLKVNNTITNTYSITNNKYIVIVDDDGNVTKRQPTYIHNQNSVSDSWTVVHNLGAFPSVTVINSAEANVVGKVAYDNENQLTLTFSSAFSGKAYLN